MKNIGKLLACFATVVLLAVATGCASPPQASVQWASGAGFKIIKPTAPDQQAILAKLPAGKMSQITYNGKTYYVLPDLPNNQAYVGGPRQYQVYLELVTLSGISADKAGEALADQRDMNQLEQRQMNQMAWGSWLGWGDVAGFVP